MRVFYSVLKVLLAAIASISFLSMATGAVLAQSMQPAHAKVLRAEPAIGSTITNVPTKVTVFTAENIDPSPKKSNLQVYGPGADATDTLISQGNAQVSLTNPKEMSITIIPNNGHVNGVYIVNWNTTSADDGDPAAGSFVFTVNTGSTGTTPSQTPHNSAVGSSNNTASAAGIPGWVPFVTAIVALLVGLLGGLGLGRRRSGTPSFAAMRASIAHDTDKKEESTSI